MRTPLFDRRAGPWLRFLVVLAAVLCTPLPARAWIEQVVAGHETRVSLDAAGWVEARHQLTLTLRGGPLRSIEIEGVGDGIELLSDAKVTRVKNANGPGIPLRSSLSEGGALRLEVLGIDGLRSGTYRFDFAYRLDANGRKLLERAGDRITLSWVGPRLPGGVDSAKVLISLPHAEMPPTLPTKPERAARGVLLGQILVGSTRDEVELLRTHIAVGEPAVWQVEFDAAVLTQGRAEDATRPLALAESRALLPRTGQKPLHIALALGVAAGVALLFARKERAVRLVSERTDSRARPLVPAPSWLRALLGALAALGFVALTFQHRVAWAMACGVVLALLAVHFPPVRRSSPRGPGSWIPLVASAHSMPRWPLSVRAYDPSTLPGFALAFSLLLFGLGLAYSRLPHDSVQALMSLALVLLLSPSFLTGRLADFPCSPLEQALPWLRFLQRTRLGPIRSLELWGRKTDREAALGPVDEVRLRIVLDRPPSGLRALEVAFEEGPGSYVSPCLLLRVVEDSPAHESLPEVITWSRGRQSEEKTAILRPPAPTRAQLLRLLKSVLAHLKRDVLRPSASSSVRNGAPPPGASTFATASSV